MENRHLFRGKTDDGRWVQGAALWHDNGLVTIFNQHPADGSLQGFEVDPDSVCQCTGLKDKNDNLIWEKDIVRFDVYKWDKLVSSVISDISWCDDLCALSVTVNHTGTKGTLGHFLEFNKEAEVIGNTIDNPELLSELNREDDYDIER